MTERTYRPTGTGLCRRPGCGRDIRAHVDAAHEFEKFSYNQWGYHPEPGDIPSGRCRCGAKPDDPIHDVGRELRCPEVRRAVSKSEYKRVTALGGDILPPEVDDD